MAEDRLVPGLADVKDAVEHLLFSFAACVCRLIVEASADDVGSRGQLVGPRSTDPRSH
jgi:hypothetical protein